MYDTNEDKKKLRSLALRNLLRAGGSKPEGLWSNQLKLRVSEPEFQGFLAGLETEGLVVVSPGSYGHNRKVELTPAGKAEAMKLVHELVAETYGHATAAE